MSDSPSTHASLLVRIRDHADRQAWAQFVEIYTPLVFKYCKRYRLDHADAADVSQDVLHAVGRVMPDFEYDPNRGSFKGWLFTVIRSKVNNHFARCAREVRGTGETAVHQMLDARPGPDEKSQWDTDCERRLFDWAAEQVKKEFAENTWDAFWRTAVENQPAKDVAAALGISVGAVYIARSRVMSRVRERVKQVSEA